MKMLAFILITLLAAFRVDAATLTVTPNGIQGGIVTAGIPFAACALSSTDNFRLKSGTGAEVPIFIKPTLYWPDARCIGQRSIRAVKVQFQFTSAQAYTWEHAARTLPPLTESPAQEITSTNPARAPYKEPAFFVINDPAYLVTTGLIPPTTVAGTSDYDRVWFPSVFANRLGRVDFSTTVGENWLFDAVSTTYQQALRTGNVEYYREAYLEHEFYMSKIVTDATATTLNAGTFGLSIGDVKYVYLTPEKLHLALTGDDSWTPQENAASVHASVATRDLWIQKVAARAITRQAIGAPYTNLGVRFTERETGFAFQQLLAAYELTNDPALLTSLNTAVNNLHRMMTNNPDGLGNNGYLSHSWDAHEGSVVGYIGKTPIFTESLKTFSEMTIRNPIGQDYTKIKAGMFVGFKAGPNKVALAADLTKNADGTLTAKFATPVEIKSDQWMYFSNLSNGLGTESVNLEADRVFSPWMQAVVADGLWQYYNFTNDAAVKTKIREMLLGFGRAITAYAIHGLNMDPALKTKIETAFGVKVISGRHTASRGIAPHTRYVASAAMGGPDATADYVHYMNYDGGGFSDQHSAESLYQVALAINFETDQAKKAAMTALAQGLTNWFGASTVARTTNNPVRYYSWTGKQDPWGAYQFVMGAAGPVIPPPVVIPPVIPPVSGVTKPTFISAASSVDQWKFVYFQFWTGLPDVNNDGCLDLFVGTHGTRQENPAAMYIQKNENNTCAKTFNYYDNAANYSQVVGFPRTTSRYSFGNFYGNPDGIPAILGQDADRAVSARYLPTGLDAQGRPIYATKSNGCYQQSCVPFDADGDGVLEFVSANDVSNTFVRTTPQRIYSATGTKLADLVPPAETRLGAALVVFDVNGDGSPEIVNPVERGYWSRSGTTWTWNANKFPETTIHQWIFSAHIAPFDYDNDGDYDLYAAEVSYNDTGSSGPMLYGPPEVKPYLFRNEGDGTFTNVTPGSGLDIPKLLHSADYHSAYGSTFPADVNLDGYMDLVYGGERSGYSVRGQITDYAQVVFLLNNGNGTFTVDRGNDFGQTDSRPWTSMADYDNDGRLDLLKLYKGDVSAILWRNTTSNGNHWLRVRVQGKTTDGHQARVTLRDPDTGQIVGYQQVGNFTHSSYNLLPHFGLASLTKADVEVSFPHGGPVCTYPGIAADQDIIVRLENCDIVAPYIPGTNPTKVPANGTPPVEDPQTDTTIAELQALILELQTNAASAVVIINSMNAEIITLMTDLEAANDAVIVERDKVSRLLQPVQATIRRTETGIELQSVAP